MVFLPVSITVLEVNKSAANDTLRTRTEYNAQVSAAASRLRLPTNNDEVRFAVRGSMTAITPSVEIH